MKDNRIGSKVVWLDEVSSTNEYVSTLKGDNAQHGVVVAARNQTHGRGQRGNSWESESGKNLLFSVLLRPCFLEVQYQFLISKISALAVVDLLLEVIPNITIKWPNDIYVKGNKIAGILIENSFSAANLETTIVGIGLNVNQFHFADDLPNPTSLVLETGKEADIDSLLERFCRCFELRYQQLKAGSVRQISDQYFASLYRSAGFNKYSANGEAFSARIVGVKDTGMLVLETDKGELKEFAFKEVCFVL